MLFRRIFKLISFVEKDVTLMKTLSQKKCRGMRDSCGIVLTSRIKETLNQGLINDFTNPIHKGFICEFSTSLESGK